MIFFACRKRSAGVQSSKIETPQQPAIWQDNGLPRHATEASQTAS